MKFNWIKVGANTGVAFFSTLGSLLTFDSLTGGTIPKEIILPASMLVAGIQGCLSFCKEMHSEADKIGNPEKYLRKSRRKRSSSLKILENLTIW